MRGLIKLILTFFILLSLLSKVGYAEQALFFESCPITHTDQTNPESAALLAVFAKAAIPIAVNWGAAALAAQGESESKTWNIKGSSFFYNLSFANGNEILSINPSLGCLVVAIPDKEMSSSEKVVNTEFKKAYTEKVLAVESLKNQLPTDPVVYLELEVETFGDGSNFRLVPKVLYYKRHSIKNWFNKERDLAFTFNFNKIGEDKPFTSTTLSFENLKPETYINYSSINNQLGVKTTEMLQIAAPDSVVQNDIADYKKAYLEYENSKKQLVSNVAKIKRLKTVAETPYKPDPLMISTINEYCKQLEKSKLTSQHCPPKTYLANFQAAYELNRLEAIAELRKNDDQNENVKLKEPVLKDFKQTGAFNLSVTMTETREASVFFKHLAEAINNSKKEIGDELVKKLIPSEREAAKKLLAESELKNAVIKDEATILALTANQNVYDAQNELDLALKSPGESPVTIEKLKNALLIAKFKANKAYREAGLPTVQYNIPSIP